MVKFSKSIGIVGGAGPIASAFLYRSILQVCQQKYGANDYNEFPEIILISYPFTRGDQSKIRADIANCFSNLKKAGAALFCIASHSFHGYLPTLPTGFVNLITASLEEANQRKISRALILASETTIHLRLYKQSDMECVYLPVDDQSLVNQLIREVAGGKINDTQAKKLQEMVCRLQDGLGFDGVVIACTELPLIPAECPVGLLVVDTIQVLAKELVDRATLAD